MLSTLPSDLQARLGLKACVLAWHSGAQGLDISKTEPVPEALSVLGSQRPASQGKLRLWVSQLLFHSYEKLILRASHGAQHSIDTCRDKIGM